MFITNHGSQIHQSPAKCKLGVSLDNFYFLGIDKK